MNDNARDPRVIKMYELRYSSSDGVRLNKNAIATVQTVVGKMVERLIYGQEARFPAINGGDFDTSRLGADGIEERIIHNLCTGQLIDAINYLVIADQKGYALDGIREKLYPTRAISPAETYRDIIDQIFDALGVSQLSPALQRIESLQKSAPSTQAAHNDLPMSSLTEMYGLLGVKKRSEAIDRIKTLQSIEIMSASPVTVKAKIESHSDDAYKHIAEIPKAGHGIPEKGRPRAVAMSSTFAAAYGVQPCNLVLMQPDDAPSVLFSFKSETDMDNYLPLLRTLLGALDQAANGKGRERHANDNAFTDQPILNIARLLNSDGGLAQQVIKKVIEARTLPTHEQRVRELQGAINYTAAMIMYGEGRLDTEDYLHEGDEGF